MQSHSTVHAIITTARNYNITLPMPKFDKKNYKIIVYSPNSIWMQSSILPQTLSGQYTNTDRPTDRWDRQWVYIIIAYAHYVDKD